MEIMGLRVVEREAIVWRSGDMYTSTRTGGRSVLPSCKIESAIVIISRGRGAM